MTNPFTGTQTTLDAALPTVAAAAPDSYAVGQQPSPVIVNRQPSQVTGNAPAAPTQQNARGSSHVFVVGDADWDPPSPRVRMSKM